MNERDSGTPTRSLSDSGPILDRGEYSQGDILAGQYRVLRVCRGGMGVVYIVEDIASAKPLRMALKTFQRRYLFDNSAVQRFEKEATNWVKLEFHPAIVYAAYVQTVEAMPYIFLEFVNGESLAERLSRNKLEIEDILRISLHFCAGMRYAVEKHSLIHRDIKPGNMLLRDDGVLKITDFGLSKLQSELAEQANRHAGVPIDPDMMQTVSNVFRTASGFCVGTPAYISPEAVTKPSEVDTRADIYSFGIVLYEILTGTRPFKGPNILQQQLLARPPIVHTIPLWLRDILFACLEKDPKHRFQSFRELESALEDVASEHCDFRGVVAHTPSVAESYYPFFKGFTLMQFGKFDDAIAYFSRVLSIEPKDAESHNNIAVCLAKLSRLKEAKEHLNQAVTLKPDYPEAWANLGDLCGQIGLFHEGMDACDRAILLKPEWAEAHSNKGANLLELGQFDQAIASFQEAIKLDPNYWKAYVRMAQAHLRHGQTETALALAEKALLINPREAFVLAMAAACLEELGRIGEARDYLLRSIELDPGDETVRAFRELWIRKHGGL